MSNEEDWEEVEEEEVKEEEIPASSATILYDLMNVSKTAKPEEIRKAFRKLALLKHPDKNPDDPKAAESFQKLNKAYQVLSDPKKRARYDQFGDDGENEDFGSGDWVDAYEYYRAVHPELTKTDIKTFKERYRHSEEEQTDLLDFYEEHEGDISAIIECIMCSDNDDVQRFVKFFEEQIKAGELERTKAFDKSKNSIRKLENEAAEAKKEKAKLKQKKAAKAGGGDFASLEAMILAKRNNAEGGFMAYMEQKYC